MLKAHVAELTQSEPARTHSLEYLVRTAGLQLPPEIQDFVGEIANGSVPTRYTDDLEEQLRTYSRDVAERCLGSAEEALTWLREHPSLKE